MGVHLHALHGMNPWHVIVAVLAVLAIVEAFNLEPRMAVVKEGRPGSYFGYSVSQHQVVGRDSIEAIALVGAPLDNSGQPGTNRCVNLLTWLKRLVISNLVKMRS